MPEPETAKAKATPEQISEIKRIKASKDLYKILNIEKDATDDEIKKAYRKLALKLHPDKSSAPGTEEAFKSLSTAFATLSDKEKRSNYDAFGNENVNRHNHQFNQFNGQDIDPQELFNMFFNGAMNQNVHQFHFGPRQRNFARRDIFQEIFNQQQHHHQERQENTIIGRIIPYLFLLFMLYNALIPTTDTSSSYSLQKSYRHPIERKTKSRSVLYHVSNSFDRKYQGYQVKRVEEIVEHEFMLGLQNGCYREREVQNDMIRRAQGWFSNDLDLLKKAQDMKMEKCVELREFLKK